MHVKAISVYIYAICNMHRIPSLCNILSHLYNTQEPPWTCTEPPMISADGCMIMLAEYFICLMCHTREKDTRT